MDELTPSPKIRIHFGPGLNSQRWPVVLDDASTTASLIVSHSHWLDGITMSGSPYSAVSSRFCLLITSRQTGDDAVTRTTAGVGLDDTKLSSHQHRIRVIKEQPAFFAAHPPSKRTVSGERIAPIRCTRLATAAIFNHTLPAMSALIVPSLAGPASA
jgi:hypothetical protein